MDKDRGICDETTDPNISERNWNLNKMRHYPVETAWDNTQGRSRFVQLSLLISQKRRYANLNL